MRAILVHVTDRELVDRRSKGLDRWDEMWDGVLHMTPAPSFEHQRILDRLIGFLEPLLRMAGRGQLASGINVFENDAEAIGVRFSRIAGEKPRLAVEDAVDPASRVEI